MKSSRPEFSLRSIDDSRRLEGPLLEAILYDFGYIPPFQDVWTMWTPRFESQTVSLPPFLAIYFLLFQRAGGEPLIFFPTLSRQAAGNRLQLLHPKQFEGLANLQALWKTHGGFTLGKLSNKMAGFFHMFVFPSCRLSIFASHGAPMMGNDGNKPWGKRLASGNQQGGGLLEHTSWLVWRFSQLETSTDRA